MEWRWIIDHKTLIRGQFSCAFVNDFEQTHKVKSPISKTLEDRITISRAWGLRLWGIQVQVSEQPNTSYSWIYDTRYKNGEAALWKWIIRWRKLEVVFLTRTQAWKGLSKRRLKAGAMNKYWKSLRAHWHTFGIDASSVGSWHAEPPKTGLNIVRVSFQLLVRRRRVREASGWME